MQTTRTGPQAGPPHEILRGLVQRMRPVETANVVAIRPGLLPRSMTAEEAFIAWALALPAGADARAAARAALETTGWPEEADAAPALFRAYLREVAEMPAPLQPARRRARRPRRETVAR